MHSTSLNFTDVLEIVALCAVVFFPLGMWFAKNLNKIKWLFSAVFRMHTNLKDQGSFKDFMTK